MTRACLKLAALAAAATLTWHGADNGSLLTIAAGDTGLIFALGALRTTRRHQ